MKLRKRTRAIAVLLPGTLFAVAALAGDVRAAGIVRDYVGPAGQQLHLRLAGTEEDRTGSRLPLIALHLVPNSGQVFERFQAAMGARRPVIAVDLPGFGMSDPVSGDETVGNYAARILAGLRELGHEQVDLLGFHTGAAVAAEIAVTDPGRVRRVVLAALPVLTDEERAQFAALPPIEFDLEGRFAQSEWQRSLRWRGPGQSVESVYRTFAEKMRPGARERGATAVVRYELADRLAEISQPVFVLRPRDDLWHATARARDLLPYARWDEYPAAGHGFFEVEAEALARTIDGFLESPSSERFRRSALRESRTE